MADEYSNVFDLKAFYDSALGRYTCQRLRLKITALWHEISREKILGFGFTLPYLPLFSYGNECFAFMPSTIGAMKIKGSVPCVMADCINLPAKNEYFDRVIIVHGLENCELPAKLLEEIWRVLKPAGKLLVIVPNQGTFWQKIKNPFRTSRVFSRHRLINCLTYSKFTPKKFRRALFFIPTKFRNLNRLCGIIGMIFWRPFSGVLIVEAEKLIFAASGRTIKIPLSPWKLFKPKLAGTT